jgi:acyl-CoA thioesterase FadM
MTFRYATTVSLADTDASGYLFYGSLFRLTQICFEAFLKSLNLPIELWVSGDLPALPVRHVEAEYLSPLRAGTSVEVRIVEIAPGETSLRLSFTIVRMEDESPLATARVVHVAVQRNSGVAVPLPPSLTQALRPQEA